MKIRYDVEVMKPSGPRLEPFSGVFEDENSSQKWYKKHGRNWEKQGKKLVKREFDFYKIKKQL
jgi:hypothetical protein